MLLHLPLVENRIAQFGARFERHGAGWLYYGDRLTGGLPVSDAEHSALLAEHAREVRHAARVMAWWLPAAVIACVAWDIAVGASAERESWRYVPVLLLPVPWVVWRWHLADGLADALVGRRVAVTPPRARWRGIQSRVAALPAGVGVMLLLVCGLLAFQSRPWETDQQRLWLAEAVAGILLGAGLLVVKWRARR